MKTCYIEPSPKAIIRDGKPLAEELRHCLIVIQGYIPKSGGMLIEARRQRVEKAIERANKELGYPK